MPITTTLNRIKAHSPCSEGWTKLLKHLGKSQADDEPLPYAVIARSNGIDDVLWCCRAEPEHAKTWRLFAVWCGRQVEHLMEDERSKNALNVAERHANGVATDKELHTARVAARAKWGEWGARAALAALASAQASALAAALAAAQASAQGAAQAAALASAQAAAQAARGEWVAARDAQLQKFIEMVGE